MTGTTGQRTDSALPNFDEDDLDALRKRKVRREQIMNGALPSVAELLSGMPFAEDNLQTDVMLAVDIFKAKYSARVDASVMLAVEIARAHPVPDFGIRVTVRMESVVQLHERFG